MGIGVLVLLWDGLRALRRGKLAGDNPWNAWTLEWATSSPPPAYNFVALPAITSARPLWDLQHPGAVPESRSGPGTELIDPSGVSESRPGQRTGTVSETHAGQVSGLVDRGGVSESRPGQWSGPVNPAGREADQERAWRPHIVGIVAFIFSEVTFFAALIVAYLEYRTRSPGPGPHDLDVPRTLVFSLFLFASSGTVYLAERRLAKNDQRGFLTWWVLSIGLGAVFLIGQLTEYARLYTDGITIGTNLFTSAFFTLTGFHGLHVFVGLIALSVIGLLARAGDFRGGRRRVAVDGVSIYWHFVDGIWVVIFSLVYLLGLVS